MSKTLGRAAVAGAVALSIVFGLAACGESASDIQRKHELVDLLTQRAVATCSVQKDHRDQAPYQKRLEDVLYRTKSETLDYFKDNGITICLDKRLETQDNGFFGPSHAYGVYYPQDKILTLIDNGKSVDQKSWYQSSAASNGPTFLREFSHSFGGYFDNYKSVSDVAYPMLAHKYTTSCGKSCTSTHYVWRAMPSINAKTLGVNTFLQTPLVLNAP